MVDLTCDLEQNELCPETAERNTPLDNGSLADSDHFIRQFWSLLRGSLIVRFQLSRRNPHGLDRCDERGGSVSSCGLERDGHPDERLGDCGLLWQDRRAGVAVRSGLTAVGWPFGVLGDDSFDVGRHSR